MVEKILAALARCKKIADSGKDFNNHRSTGSQFLSEEGHKLPPGGDGAVYYARIIDLSHPIINDVWLSRFSKKSKRHDSVILKSGADGFPHNYSMGSPSQFQSLLQAHGFRSELKKAWSPSEHVFKVLRSRRPVGEVHWKPRYFKLIVTYPHAEQLIRAIFGNTPNLERAKLLPQQSLLPPRRKALTAAKK